MDTNNVVARIEVLMKMRPKMIVKDWFNGVGGGKEFHKLLKKKCQAWFVGAKLWISLLEVPDLVVDVLNVT